VPLEAVNSENGVPFVYKQSGGSVEKHEVVTGAMNDNDVIIAKGLDENDQVLLSPPADKEKLELVRLPGSATPPKAGGDTALGPRPIPPAAVPPSSPAPTGSPPSGKPPKPGLAAKKG
jgi:hypothetical protein